MEWSDFRIIKGGEPEYGIGKDVSGSVFKNQYIGVSSSEDVTRSCCFFFFFSSIG